MTNVLIVQPYLSNRKLSSNTIERQFRFLTKRPNTHIYVLLDASENEYAKHLIDDNTGFYPLVVSTFQASDELRKLHEQFGFDEVYIARTYFTPATQENIEQLKHKSFDIMDFRYWRDFAVIELAYFGIPVHHVIYDPLELQYDELIPKSYYKKYSSMTNVQDAAPHNFADIGYYDLEKEVDAGDKMFKFTFGGTAFSEERANLVLDIYHKLKDVKYCNLYARAGEVDDLVDNSLYEEQTSQSLFTYTIPSQCKEYMSFTRMLLALSQGTIPLIHPDNNLDCLFGEGFEFRQDIKTFFNDLIISPDDLQQFIMGNSFEELVVHYNNMLDKWKDTKYYQWLQEHC